MTTNLRPRDPGALPIRRVERERDNLRDLLLEALPHLEGDGDGYPAGLVDRIRTAVRDENLS